MLAGFGNTEGSANAFFGTNAGESNGTGNTNAFFGFGSGIGSTSGSNNSALGARASLGSGALTNATAIGANAQVDQSDALVLGSIAGINGATASVKVGVGTTDPQATLHVNGGALVTPGGDRQLSLGTPNGETGIGIRSTGNRADVRFDGSTLKLVAGPGSGPPASTSGIAVDTSGNVGIGTLSPLAKLDVNGNARIILASGGNQSICLTAAGVVASCGSSLRYKTQVHSFFAGLDLIKRLRPITFTWKDGGGRDLGFGAEEVAKVEPLLVTHNGKGEIEGVKYDHLNVVLVNAIKQQQSQIEALQAANAGLIARLRAVENSLGKVRRLNDSTRRSD